MITLSSGLTVSNHNFSIVLSHPKPSRIILAVPHDGLIANDFSEMFEVRASGVKVRDMYVWPLANDIIQKGLRMGVNIDAVRFLMARAYVDANREMPCESNLDLDTRGQTAFDDPLLSLVYQNYHSELCRLTERSIHAFGVEHVLFIDLHGFGHQPRIAPPEGYDLILGTANRATIHHGEVDRAFARFMEEHNYSVFLPGEKFVVPEGDPFNAGHTTRWYAKQYGINAIQIEIASTFRKSESTTRGEILATDVAEFLSRFYR